MSRQQYFGSTNKDIKLKTIPLHAVAPDNVRVAIKAIGINRLDTQALDCGMTTGLAIGCDFAGIVTEVGERVHNTKVGDQVAGVAAAYNAEHPQIGSFADSIDVPAVALLRFTDLEDRDGPINSGPISTFTQAGTVGVSVLTAALGFILYSSTPLKKNSKSGLALVYGGRGALAFAAAQMAKYIGYEVIIVASPTIESLYAQLGFKHILDYRDSLWPAKAKAIGDITWAFETIGDDDSLEKVKAAVSDKLPVDLLNSRYVSSKHAHEHNINLKLVNAFMWFELRREALPWVSQVEPVFHAGRDGHFEAVNEFIKEYISLPVEVYNDLAAIPEALERARTVSGEKIAVRLP